MELYRCCKIRFEGLFSPNFAIVGYKTPVIFRLILLTLSMSRCRSVDSSSPMLLMEVEEVE